METRYLEGELLIGIIIVVLISDSRYSILFYNHCTKGTIIKRKIFKCKILHITSNLKKKLIWGIYIKVHEMNLVCTE